MSNLTYAIADPVTPYDFLNIPISSFDASADTINLGVNHNFITGDHIWAYTASFSGSNLLGGIERYKKYFVIVVNSTTIKLATTLQNANTDVVLDISSPPVALNFFKVYKPFEGSVIPIFLTEFPAYAKSSVLFNSSTPVEINFRIPGYIAPSEASFSWPVGLMFKSPTENRYWGGMIRLGFNSFHIYSNFLLSGSTSIFSATISATVTGVSTVTGYNQRYVITPSRTIEMWVGAVGQNLNLVYTTPALSNNTPLELVFGSNFSFCKVENATIKYL